VAGLDDVRLARTDLELGPVLVLDGEPAPVDDADAHTHDVDLRLVGAGY
jgi:hypothetical protein